MKLTLLLSAKKVLWVLAGIVAVLTLTNLVHQFSWFYFQEDYYYLGWKFDVSGDENIPTWYSSFSLWICAALIWIVGMAEREKNGRFTRHWQGLALIFLFLSLDETATIHEWSGSLLADWQLSGFFFYAWTVFGLIFVAVLGLAYFRFFWALPPRTRWLFLIAGALYVGGALGVEMINADYESLYGANNLTYQLTTAVEELAEMAGIVIFIYALLSYLQTNLQTLHIQFGE